MAARKKSSMAQPQSRRRSRSAAAPSPLVPTPRRRQAVTLTWLTGPVAQQFAALALVAWGVVSVATIAGWNAGALIGAWARALVLLFGWGAYPVAALLAALGALWLRHLVHQPTAWRWRPFIGLEMTLFSLLALTHTLVYRYGWTAVTSGRGGGLLGWGLSVALATYVGPLITGFFYALLALWGVVLVFDWTWADVRRAGEAGLAWLKASWEARHQEEKEEEAPARSNGVMQLGQGVLASPVEARPAAPAPTVTVAEAPKPAPAAAPSIPQPEPAPAVRPEPKPTLPPLTLLRQAQSVGMSDEEIRTKSRIIEQTLAQFGVPAEVVEVRRGPTVTQFGVAPGYITRAETEGEQQRKVRVSQIASLRDDLALALAARSLRIEAPVPGRAVVGIEVPNDEVALVTLRSVLESEAFQRKARPLSFAVGLDVAGSPVVADLGSMPHLLVAGTTGSGKSIFIKALAACLVLRNTPQQLRLVTIDPKMVELSRFNGLPHLYGRAETDLERAQRVLRWVAHEMDARYKLFASYAARNLDDYNARLQRLAATNPELTQQLLPRIVVLIDELADLMLSAPEETERTLTRLAQMARATGIHLVVATQRPSTDVVTGLIKANFPARISFATASQVDSRVILDTPGAESLLGRGDMLFLAPDASAPKRVQGCYISEEELEAIIRYWQQQVGATPALPPWDTFSAEDEPEGGAEKGQAEEEDERLIEQAIALARQTGSISTSAIQRRLRISYNRAALIMEELEQRGIVGPQESAGRPRRVILGGEEEA